MSQKTDIAVELFQNGCACSQAILSAYGPAYGLDRSTAMRTAAGFAGGMRMGETCGAVTGAYMVLGLALCGDDCPTRPGRQKIYDAVQVMTRHFAQRNGSVSCKILLGVDPNTSEGLQKANDNGLFKTICPKMVRDAAEILEQILSKNSK